MSGIKDKLQVESCTAANRLRSGKYHEILLTRTRT